MLFFSPLFVQNKKQISQGNVLVLKDATFDTAGTYVCVVTVPEIEGMKKNGTLRVNVQGKYTLTNTHYYHVL